MWTLAIETTSALGSMALLRDATVAGRRELEAKTYSAQIFTELAALLDDAQLRSRDIGLFAVADGPGSFTGVRIGLAAVKGLLEGLGQAVPPAVAVSTLRAVATPERADGTPGPALAALDASRGEVYFGCYPGGPEADAGEEGLESLDAFAQRLAANPNLPAFTPHAQLLERCPGLRLRPPRLAAAVGYLGLEAFRRGQAADALRLDARYIRRSDAELYAPAR